MQRTITPPLSDPNDDNRHSDALREFFQVEAEVLSGDYSATTDDESLEAVNLCVRRQQVKIIFIA